MITSQTLKLPTKEITKGDTFFEVYTFTDDNDQPIDLTVYDDIKMDIRRGLNERSALIYSASLDNGEIIIIDINTLSIEIPKTETVNWRGGDYHRDVRFFYGATIQTFLAGHIKVRENITIA